MAVPRHFAVFAVLLSILLSLTAATCAPRCRFNLCTSRSVLFPDAADKPLTSRICLGRRRIGIVNTNSSLVRTNNDDLFAPLENFSPRGLSQSFAPTFFKAFPRRQGGSGVGIQVPQGNQGNFVNGLCVALSVTAYQVLKDGNVVDNVNIKNNRPLVDCISFRVQGKPRRHSGRPVRTTAPTARPTRVFTPIGSPPPDDEVDVVGPIPAPSITPQVDDSVVTAPPVVTVTALPSAKPIVPEESESPEEPVIPVPDSSVPKIPKVASPNETIIFPPSVAVSDRTTFFVDVEVAAASGAIKEDFYLLSDATSSMTVAIDEAKSRFSEVVQARLVASNDVAFGVGFYRDEREDFAFKNVQSITKNAAAVQAGIDSLDAGSQSVNLDTPEGNLPALFNIATKVADIGWREDSRRILVYFGDAPGYEPSCVGPQDLTRTNVIAALKKEKITVVASSFTGGSFSPGLDAPSEAFSCSSGTVGAGPGQATAITEQTGGMVVEAAKQEMLIDSILKSVGSLDQVLEADVSDCTAQDIDVTFKPELPLTIGVGSTGRVRETVVVNESVCSAGGTGFSCQVKFTLSNAAVGTQTLTSAGLAGC